MLRILHLTLKRQWFDKIASGEKTEEYRDIKPYWISRLVKVFDAPHSCEDFKDITIDVGKEKWGAEYAKPYFIIKLGKILSIKNYKPIKTIQ